MDKKTTSKVFLQICQTKVVEHALKNGLDEECYYNYLLEVYRALSCDSGVRRKYHDMLDDAERHMVAKFRTAPDNTWQNCYSTIFKRQINFMLDLMEYCCTKVVDEATMALARGMMNFIRVQLHNQKRHLNTVERLANMKDGVDAEKLRNDFEYASHQYDSAMAALEGAYHQLDNMDY
jgi:hypothetical protein